MLKELPITKYIFSSVSFGFFVLFLLKQIKDGHIEHELNQEQLYKILGIPRTTCRSVVQTLIREEYVYTVSEKQSNGHGRHLIPRLTRKGNYLAKKLLK